MKSNKTQTNRPIISLFVNFVFGRAAGLAWRSLPLFLFSLVLRRTIASFRFRLPLVIPGWRICVSIGSCLFLKQWTTFRQLRLVWFQSIFLTFPSLLSFDLCFLRDSFSVDSDLVVSCEKNIIPIIVRNDTWMKPIHRTASERWRQNRRVFALFYFRFEGSS